MERKEIYQNKVRLWKNAKKYTTFQHFFILIKILKIYEICNNNAAANNCKYNNTTNYKGNGVYEKWYLGKMEVNLNDGKKKKYLYFQFN